MRKNAVLQLVILLIAISFTSCKDDEVVPISDLKVFCYQPKGLKNAVVDEMKIRLKNNTTGIVINQNYADGEVIKVEEGIYSIAIEGMISYETVAVDKSIVKQKKTLKGISEAVNISGKEVSMGIDLFIAAESNGFVFSEIYFTGSKTPKGSQYSSDKFFEIYNNSNETLYADGLCISETAFNTTLKQEYTPNIMADYVAVDAIYTVPGSGKEYPVAPGECLLIADIAKNHTVDNPNSIDLSKANFEWFDNDKYGIDVDVPSVPNLIKTYSTSMSVWPLHNAGFKSYVLFRMDKSADEFLAENKYDYFYNFVWTGGSIKMDESNYKIKNSLVIDAVGMSAPSHFKWTVMDPSLDMSYTHSGDKNEERYGKSVSRKISHKTSDGRIVLLDTNNSSFDFNDTTETTPGVIK